MKKSEQMTALGYSVNAEKGCFSLLNANGTIGWQGLQFFVTRNGERLTMRNCVVLSERQHGAVLSGVLSPEVDVSLTFERLEKTGGWSVTPRIRNNSANDFAYTGYGFLIAGGEAGQMLPAHKSEWVYAHTDNLRCEVLPHCRVLYPFIRNIPVTPQALGEQPGNGPAAIVFGHQNGAGWLMEGALTQNAHYLTWRIGLPEKPEHSLSWQARFDWNGVPDQCISDGNSAVLEAMGFWAFEADPDRIYKPYIDELCERYDFAGRHSVLGRESVFCTWNYGVYADVNETDILTRMDAAAKVQRGGFFQIDHGYQPVDTTLGHSSPEADAYYPDAKRSWDRERFPSGPNGFVTACAERGLRPSIWFSPRVQIGGVIAREHPDWLLRNRGGEIIDLGHLMLDYSILAVRDFLEQCIRTITQEWGFQGIKLDFFSWMFDHPELVFSNGGTGVYWKMEFLRMIRSHLGPSGYFLHCVAAPMGDPFLAISGCDAYRTGYDISEGSWKEHTRSCGWSLPGLLANGGRTWFGNLDSCMGMPGIPREERRSRLAFAYITAGMLEFSGRVENFSREELDDYRRLDQRADQGKGFRCPDIRAFYGPCFPTVLMREHEPQSHTRGQFSIRATFALFNWGDEEKVMSISLSSLGIDSKAEKLYNFWSGRVFPCAEDVLTVRLEPRGSLLIDVI